MSREDLKAMFTELAEDISYAEPVGAALAHAVRVRRRRRAVIGAALAVLVVTAVSVAVWRPTGRSTSPVDPPGGTAEPTMTGTARVDRLPSVLAVNPDGAPYWPRSVQVPTDAPRLADAPMSHAAMLFSPYAAEFGTKPPPIYVYGEGSVNEGSGNGRFHWARLAVDLSYTRDVDGNLAVPLDQNSLGPGGEVAAFAQRDSVVLVDVRTGAVERIALPGLNEDVSWLVNGRHVLVSSATETWLVDTCYRARFQEGCTEARAPAPAAARGTDVAALVGGGSGLATLTVPGPGRDPLVRFYDDGGLAEEGQRSVDMGSAAPYQISDLSPRGWRYGNLIAQAAGGRDGSAHANFVAVIDDQAGTVTHILDLGTGRAKGCCSVLGWAGSDDVLVYADEHGLLDWNLSTRAVTRLTEPAPGGISVASGGCDYSIKIAGITYGCVV